MNPLVAIGFWSGMYWREQCESLALLARAAKAKRKGDEIGHRKYRELARATESRLVALTAALEVFCRSRKIDPAQAFRATVATTIAGTERFMPTLDVAVDLNYQARVESVLAELSTPAPATHAEGRKGVWS
jgi:hypothetical protein